MSKADLLKHITASLKQRLLVLQRAALSSHAEATDEGSKSENKYDTRGLEAGYLAQGQARQVRELVDAIKLYENMEPHDFAADEPIDLLALIELEVGDSPATCFIGPRSGGLEIPFEGGTLVVITPSSPLGQALMGKSTGQRWTAKVGEASFTYRIVSVR